MSRKRLKRRYEVYLLLIYLLSQRFRVSRNPVFWCVLPFALILSDSSFLIKVEPVLNLYDTVS